MKETIKVRELFGRDIDIDVLDDVCEELYISFVGPIKLTEAGEEKFKEVLDLDIEVREDDAILLISHRDDWEGLLKKSKTLFNSAAGYCSSSNWDKWFQS